MINGGSYISAHVLLNLLNKLGKSDKNVRLAEHFIVFTNVRFYLSDDITGCL